MKKLIIAMLFFACAINLSAQESCGNILNATGGTYENSNMTFEWNVGEIALINTMQSDDGKLSVTNGCLQPSNSLRFRQRAMATFAPKDVSILPNPASDFISVRIQTAGEGRMNLSLFSEKGETVYVGQTSYVGDEANATINIKHLKNGTYILSVKLLPTKAGRAESASYKIVKIS